MQNVTIPFGSAIPDAPYSGPQPGVAFIAAMAPKRMLVMPAGASEPCEESRHRRLLAAWQKLKDDVLRKFYDELHMFWIEWGDTSYVPYFL